jgi:hypothetical protein
LVHYSNSATSLAIFEIQDVLDRINRIYRIGEREAGGAPEGDVWWMEAPSRVGPNPLPLQKTRADKG